MWRAARVECAAGIVGKVHCAGEARIWLLHGPRLSAARAVGMRRPPGHARAGMTGHFSDNPTSRPLTRNSGTQPAPRRYTGIVHARLAFYLVVGVLLVSLVSCKFSDDQYRLRGDSRVPVHVLYDSADVRGLAEQATEDDFVLSRKGKAFMKLKEEMDRQPGYEVPGGTSFKITFESPNLFYSKAEFTDGPFKSQIGWVQKGSFDDPRTRMP